MSRVFIGCGQKDMTNRRHGSRHVFSRQTYLAPSARNISRSGTEHREFRKLFRPVHTTSEAEKTT